MSADIAAANAVIVVRQLYDRIGHHIRTVREQRGATQQDLADAAGLTRTSITHVEAGRQRTPIHVLLAIAQALDVPLIALLGDQLPPLAAPLPAPAVRLRKSLLNLRDEVDAVLSSLDADGRAPR